MILKQCRIMSFLADMYSVVLFSVSDFPSVPETSTILGIEPRYHLRSRYAGLLSYEENSENDVTEVFNIILFILSIN